MFENGIMAGHDFKSFLKRNANILRCLFIMIISPVSQPFIIRFWLGTVDLIWKVRRGLFIVLRKIHNFVR